MNYQAMNSSIAENSPDTSAIWVILGVATWLVLGSDMAQITRQSAIAILEPIASIPSEGDSDTPAGPPAA